MGRVKAQYDDSKPIIKMVPGEWWRNDNLLYICLPPPVSTNNISRTRAVMVNGKAIPQYYHTAKAKKYMESVKSILRSIPGDDVAKSINRSGWIAMSLLVLPEMITLDIDNSAKLLIDCMKKDGRFMIDDCQVSAVSAHKVPRIESPARCIVTIFNDLSLEERYPIRKCMPGLFNES
jgi:Holliday junction resolvase RusA-like endonuclease